MTVEALIPLLECDMEVANENLSTSLGDEMNKQDIRKIQSSKDKIPGGELWNDGLISPLRRMASMSHTRATSSAVSNVPSHFQAPRIGFRISTVLRINLNSR
ncbi:hypothetical protein K1719_001143 [Acacia pycnantha]|nr:hypothetical protein K1719_001143 [Acacia pycnantha]